MKSWQDVTVSGARLGRRTFLETCAVIGAPAIVRRPAFGGMSRGAGRSAAPIPGERSGTLSDPEFMLALARRAIDAAMSAGATYADVRLTHTLAEAYLSGEFGRAYGDLMSPNVFPSQGFLGNLRDIDFGGGSRPGAGVSERPLDIDGTPILVIAIGVRSFVHGYWGFASSPVWTDDEAIRLGQKSATQAAQNARAGAPRNAELGNIPLVQHQRWVQPGIDPFTVPIDEKLDVLRTMLELPAQSDRFANSSFGAPGLSLMLWREERVFASSEGASYSQLRYRCEPGALDVNIHGDIERGESDAALPPASWTPDALTARGWETFRNLDVAALTQRLLNQANAQRFSLDASLTTKPVDIGKYDVVFGAPATAEFVYQTLGAATELDRAMGYEANASGTSYLGPDPLQYLGTEIANTNISLTADRTTPHAVATAMWDDEGVRCTTFPLIRDGVLVDYQTTREQANWLASWYAKRNMPVQSHGCAQAATALDCPIQMSPNFQLAPGPHAITVDDLIKDTARGVYFPRGWLNVDQQAKNGVYGNNRPDANGPREIRNGRLGPVLIGAATLFGSQELWKNVVALGGEQSAGVVRAVASKGEPAQRSWCNVRAVPMKVHGCAIINWMKKA